MFLGSIKNKIELQEFRESMAHNAASIKYFRKACRVMQEAFIFSGKHAA